MKFNKEVLFNALIIVLIVVGSLEFYQQIINLSPRGVAERIASLATKYSLWIGLGLKALDWIIKQKETNEKIQKQTLNLAESNNERITELVRIAGEQDARTSKLSQDLIVFKAETSVRGSLGELRQEVRELQNKFMEMRE